MRLPKASKATASSKALKAVVLGAAAAGGYPQWDCACPVCALARSGDARVRRATQSSVAVSTSGDAWIFLNASPDIREQIAANGFLQPRGDGRHSPIVAVVLTNADIDHIAGLLSLRERQAFTFDRTAAAPRFIIAYRHS